MDACQRSARNRGAFCKRVHQEAASGLLSHAEALEVERDRFEPEGLVADLTLVPLRLLSYVVLDGGDEELVLPTELGVDALGNHPHRMDQVANRRGRIAACPEQRRGRRDRRLAVVRFRSTC